MMKSEDAALRLAAANGHRMSGWQQGDGLRWSSCQKCRMPVASDGLGEPFGAALYRICPKEAEVGAGPWLEEFDGGQAPSCVILSAIKVIRQLKERNWRR